MNVLRNGVCFTMNPIFTRTSIRRFADKSVEAEKITMVLKAAFAAPTAANQQPWEFYVVTNPEKLSLLGKSSPYATPAANAPAAIVVCYKKEGIIFPPMVHIDCAIATENILLELENQGLGGVMLGIAPVEERMKLVADALELPAHLKVFTIIPFGYPENKKAQQDRYDSARVHWIK